MYPPGSEEYKKARKRRQNRESAVRIRARKKLEECQIFSSLDLLKESTGKLKVENAQLRSENEILKHQIAMLKKLSDEKSEVSKESQEKKPKGKNFAKSTLAVMIFAMVYIANVEEKQAVSSGERKQVSIEDGFGVKPVVLTVLALFCLICAHFVFKS
jgi:predicted transcriptional regulator